MPDTTTWTTTAEVAVSSGTALHRGMASTLFPTAWAAVAVSSGTALHRWLLPGDLDPVTMDSVHRFLIAYDISDDLRRNRVAKTLESYGDRIQYSVFLIDAKPARVVRLHAALRQAMDLSEDRALICDLRPLACDGQRRMEFVGHSPSYTGAGPLVL